MRTDFSTKPKKTSSNAPAKLYIGVAFTEEQLSTLVLLAKVELDGYAKPSNKIPYNGSAIFLDILGTMLLSEGVPEARVREFINSLQ